MPETFVCAHCSKEVSMSPRCKRQRYCTERACQVARKQVWRRQKTKEDPEYQAGQRLSQSKWLLRRPDYWRQYRERNPEKTRANRERQRLRDHIRYAGDRSKATLNLAKSDAVTSENGKTSEKTLPLPRLGEYWLIPIVTADLAKSDALRVKIETMT